MTPASANQDPNAFQQQGKLPGIVGDAVQVGGRCFRVVPVPGAKIQATAKLLQQAVDQLSQYTPEQFEAACKKVQDATPGAHAKIKVQITREGTRVNRLEGGGYGVSVVSGSVDNSKVKPLFELHEVAPTVNRNFDYFTKSIASQTKGYSKEAVHTAIEAIFNEGHLFLLDIIDGKASSEWGEKTISDLLHEPGNEELRHALLVIKDSYVPSHGKIVQLDKKCYSDLLIYILKNIERSPRIVPLTDRGEMRQQFVQGTSVLHKKIADGKIIASEDMGVRGKGFPSEADKDKHRSEIIHNNTNLGSVVTYNTDNTPERVVTIRSGKSDTFERLQEHVLEACMQQLACQSPKGLVEIAPGSYEFQHAITTYLDPSSAKALGEKVKTGSDERQSLDKILQEVDKWPEGGIRVNILDANGQLIEVVLKKPIICSQLLSSTVRGVSVAGVRLATMGQEASDLINLMANSSLLALYPPQLPERLLEVKEVFEAGFKDELALSKILSNKSLLDTPEAKVYMREIANFLQKEIQEGKDKLLARALFVVLFRQAPPQGGRTLVNIVPDASEELHAADVEIMRNIVLDKLNISKGKQCKSGTDRTAIGVALASAQEKFQDRFDTTYDPTSTHTPEERLWFKTYFREALKEMGVAIVCETKGYSGIKWGGGVPVIGGIANPSAYKYLYLNEDVADLKRLGIQKNPQADVEGLTYADLGKGTSQYKGFLRDPRAFHGKSDKKFTEKLAQARKRISASDKEKALEELNTFFRDILRLKEVKAPIVGQDLELSLHVRDLHLDEPIVEGASKTRGQILKAHIEMLQSEERTLQKSLELYSLQRISSLWEQIQLADRNKTPPGSPRDLEAE